VGDGVGVQVELGNGVGVTVAVGSDVKVGSGKDAVTITRGTVALGKEGVVDPILPIDISKVSPSVRSSSPTDRIDTAAALIPSQRTSSRITTYTPSILLIDNKGSPISLILMIRP
jgi:hypothetical protein